jgi:hypothetical protein
VAAIGITAAVVLMRAKGIVRRWLAAGMLLASGTQTFALFTGYQAAVFPAARPGIAAAVGMVDGAMLVAAGAMGAIALASKSVAERATASEQA